MNKNPEDKKTWIEIDARAARGNARAFRKVIGPRVKLWAVVKSNAYGHGLLAFSRAVASDVDGFCVDSVIEGVKLRRAGIKKFILVLGPTLPPLLAEAAAEKITVGVSNLEALKAVFALKRPPQFHIKVDTGMHRQGFLLEDIPNVLKIMQKSKIKSQKYCTGIYTHFASAKDIHYPTYTEMQYRCFQNAVGKFRASVLGGSDLTAHCAATGGVLMNKRYCEGAVRVGMGLYGFYPSLELKLQANIPPRFALRPVLTWKSVISEVKQLKTGDYIGYDCSERVARPTAVAVLPVGYWHGIPRSLSSKGCVLIRGRLARVLGRVSMDLISVDATGIPCRTGDVAVLLGNESGVRADETAERAGTTHYEFLTRLNPLLERVLVS